MVGDERAFRRHVLERRLRQSVPRRVVFVEGPVRFGVMWILIDDAVIKAGNFPGALLIHHNRLWADVAMKKLDVGVEKLDTFANLDQAVLRVDIVKLVRAETVGMWHVVVIAEDIRQAREDWLSGEGDRVATLLERMLNGEHMRMSDFCQLNDTSSQNL